MTDAFIEGAAPPMHEAAAAIASEMRGATG